MAEMQHAMDDGGPALEVRGSREADPAAAGPVGQPPGAARKAWDFVNEFVKSPVFVFFVGGSFLALLPRIEEWRLPAAERQARATEQQARADAALIAPFLGNLNGTDPGRFRVSAAALRALEDASRNAHDGKGSPMFEGVNAAIETISRQLWPPPPVTAAAVDVQAAPPPVADPAAPAAAANLAQACVYIQVARDDTAKRSLAVALKAALDSRSILAPGVQYLSPKTIPNRTQVRYFNDEDRAGAAAIAHLVDEVTNSPDHAGIARPALAAKPGTLEVWLGKD